MTDCFWLRFNLDECCSKDPRDQARAIAALFPLDEQEVRFCAKEFEQYVDGCAQELDAALCARIREQYTGRRVAFFGDSITSDKLGYARIAAKVLPESVNYAVSCITSAQVLRDLEKNLAEGIPHTAVVFIGTNDACECCGRTVTTAEEYERNLNAIFSRLGGCARRILFTLPGGVQYGEETKSAFNAAIRRAAQANDCEVFDTSYVAEMQNGYEPDGVHLSMPAQRRTAERLLAVLGGADGKEKQL